MCQNEFSSTCMKGASHVSYQCMNDALLSRQLGGPNWIGTFHATDECDTTDCCCLTDVVYFNRGNNNNLHIQGQFNGQCSSASPTVYAIYAMPNTYSAEFRFLNQPITVKLSADSQTISFMETDNMACRYKAVRQSDQF
ncbi:hypothetical protein I4U23_020021 [Adineta vaga]|nr:hypothetical protein I4U23_020021 [Adineta vaga]